MLAVEGQPSGLGWMPDGSLLVVSMRDHRLLRRDRDGTVTGPRRPLRRVHRPAQRHGRRRRRVAPGSATSASTSTPSTPRATTSLKRVDPDGRVTVAAEELIFPNGTVITDDGATLIVGETLGNRYTAFTIAADGSLRDREVWAQLGPGGHPR